MMLRGSLGLESRGGSRSLWTGTGCPARCPLRGSARSAPSLVPPSPGIGRRARPMERRLLPPPSPAPGLPGQWQRGGRGAPSRGVPAPGPALTPPRTSAPLLPAGQPAAAAPPRRLGASQTPWFSSTPRHPWRSDGGGGQKAPRAGPPLTGHSIRLLLGYSAPRCCAGNPGSSLRVHVPGLRGHLPSLPPHAAAAPVGLTSASVNALCQNPAHPV